MGTIPTIIPISDLRRDAANVIRQATTSREPVFVTQRGRPSAVLVSAQSYERTQQELQILRLLARGEAEIGDGQGHDLATVLEEADRFLEEHER